MRISRIAFAVIGVMAVTGCGDGGSKVGETVKAPEVQLTAAMPELSSSVQLNPDTGGVNFENIAVHDPSVLKVEDTYYIFGSHLAAAKSADLLSWEYISSLSANHLVDESPLFNTYSSEISEGIAWTDGFTGNWAANVIQAPNGKFWFYYNHCAQDNPDTPEYDEVCWNRSYLGLAEADNIEGPYTDKGVFLRSGYRNESEFSDFPLDNEQMTYNPAIDPNAIDPAAFYDKDGQLWMVYGSYSGGIYVLAMDEETGKPETGQGYGTRLVGGDFRAMEGAFVMYSPESDYYYLMWSVAGFAANDGYNIRIARAKSPQGPYLDPAGVDISTLNDGLVVGAKLLGGFEYTQELGEDAQAWGYQSPGHNSAYYDEDSGRHLLVTHTRFPATSTKYPAIPEAHEVRVHEMFVNTDGWLVSSPQRYVPLDGDNVVAKDQAFGYYKFINHGVDSNTSAIRSGNIALNTNMTVTGSETGVWYMLDPENIKLELESGTYVGVLKWQWDDANAKLVPTFSALSSEGASVWGSFVDPISATQSALRATFDSLDIKSELTIADEGYRLPTVGKHHASISWQSSDEYYISNDGSIFIPTPDRGDQTISLTAIVTLNGESIEKAFTVTLRARPAFKNAIAHYTFNDSLTDSLGNLADAVTTDNNLLNLGMGAQSYAQGYADNAFNFDGNTGVRLPDELITSAGYTVSFWINPSEIPTHTPALFMSPADNFDQWISVIPGSVWFNPNFTVWSRYLTEASDDWNQIATASATPLNQWTHVAITYADGIMTLYLDGQSAGTMPRPEMFSGQGGDFALGVNYGWDLPYKGLIDEFIVYDYALSSLDINAAAINNLTDPAQFAAYVKDGLTLGDTSAIRDSFALPRVGPFVSGISWSSDNPKVIDTVNGMAVVTQPGPTSPDATVTLTATINFQGVIDTKTFEVTVKSKAPAEFNFDGDLISVGEAYGEGKPTGNFIDVLSGTVDYVDGVVGQAVKLDGTNGVRLPDNLITTHQYSVAFWLRPDAFTGFSTAFFGAANTSSWVSFVPAWGEDNITRLWSGTAWYDADPGGQIPLNEWSHIAFTVDNGTVTLYIDGEVRYSGENYPNVFGSGQTTYFGVGVNHWDVPFNGAMDELKIYSESISAELVQQLYLVKDAQ
ncbi:LamG-like jellyroll fold domain-containing protein [Thalassotalea mangrovi]|uniref:Beta-xylosidase n=1 Tax=Thalassotalea mangrovi TaxID=2572245 RepID=A0A4U1B2T5_9GAMM|nr:LamG-like jellyroll fold domain-containing protein [Thalassotalea mangrovi]TKB43835.1 beta-xylosidase [Thalassotalea mangrovi]